MYEQFKAAWAGFIKLCGENQGFLYKHFQSSTDIGYWPGLLIKNQKMPPASFICPGKAINMSDWVKTAQRVAMQNSFDAMFSYVHYGFNVRLSGFKISNCKRPTELILLTDCYYTDITERGYYFVQRFFQNVGYAGQLDALHSGAINTLFLDGHVAAIKVPINYRSPYQLTLNPYMFVPFSNYADANVYTWEPK